MRNALLVLALAVPSTGCAHGAYRTSYAAGATAKVFVEEAHGIYDEEANDALAGCVEKKDAGEVATQKQMDECLGPAYMKATQEKIVQALALYKTAAVAFSAVMLGCEPDPEGKPVKAATCVKRTFTDAELRQWRSELVSSAFDVIELFPNAEKQVKKLDMLLGGKR